MLPKASRQSSHYSELVSAPCYKTLPNDHVKAPIIRPYHIADKHCMCATPPSTPSKRPASIHNFQIVLCNLDFDTFMQEVTTLDLDLIRRLKQDVNKYFSLSLMNNWEFTRIC